MTQYKILLFDLDGTLTDSAEGIFKCVEYALASAGRAQPDAKTLRRFVGPPLIESFQTFCGMTYDEAEAAVASYRERYSRVGLYENRLYHGVSELLSKLRYAGYRLGIATSKPEIYTVRILKHFGIIGHFEAIAGVSLDKDNETKADMIRLCMKKMNLSDNDKPYTLMIGDRKYDIIGARECGIDCAGVLYGFAPDGELEEYKASHLVHSVGELGQILL